MILQVSGLFWTLNRSYCGRFLVFFGVLYGSKGCSIMILQVSALFFTRSDWGPFPRSGHLSGGVWLAAPVSQIVCVHIR